MSTLFSLSLPGLVVILALLGAYEMLHAKATGRRPRGVANIGFNVMDLAFRPGSEHKIVEVESQKIKRQTIGDEDEPFTEFEVDGQRFKIRIKS